MKLTTSPRLNEMLGKMGIFDDMGVLSHLPRRYEPMSYSSPDDLLRLKDKDHAIVYGELLEAPKLLRVKSLNRVSFPFRDRYGNDYSVIAWNRPYLAKGLKVGEKYSLGFSYEEKRHQVNLLFIRKGIIPAEEAIKPVYSLPLGFPEHSWRLLVERALERSHGRFIDLVPASLRAKYRLVPKEEAITLCHKPRNPEDVRQGIRALKYEEALLFSLRNQWIRKENKALVRRGKGEIDHQRLRAFAHQLPFPLTGAQKRAIGECIHDMEEPTLMYRLLQGDVGTGKTAVAAALLYANFLRGSQGAIMAPTEALARQHFQTMKSFFAGYHVNVGLLTGSTPEEEKRSIYSDVEDGTLDVLVGTHSLFVQGLHYSRLGLCIIDEQHKFGVNQRALFAGKGDLADVLLMTATPIPRTLSLTIYGDLDVSTLDEFPARKREVSTKIARPDSPVVQEAIRRALSLGKQVYIVAPRIEEGGKDASVLTLFEQYEERYPGKCVLLHGKLEEGEKEEAISLFSSGEKPILVSTQLIEVGIDVKSAALMLIYQPTSFALSSLHQLRGRIGRDGSPALCLLLYEGKDPEEIDKLNVLVKSEDGFVIAEEDLKRRGPGEITGLRQSGLPDFRYVNPVNDIKMLECARGDAAWVLSNPHNPENEAILMKTKQEVKGTHLS